MKRFQKNEGGFSSSVLAIIIIMDSRKLVLKIRPQIPKVSIRESKTTIQSVPKRKKTGQQRSQLLQPPASSSTKQINLRKASLVTRDGQDTKNTSSNEGAPISSRREAKKTERLPEIYHPKSQNKKFFSTGKQDDKNLRGFTEEVVIQKSVTEGQFLHTQASIKNHHKTELGNRPWGKRSQQKPNELSKQQKLEMYRMVRSDFHEIINASNSVAIRNPKNHFRAYIQKGNNGVLVKQILKKRWWWHIQEDPSKANFIWTEWYNKQFAENLPYAASLDETISAESYTRKNPAYGEKTDKSEAIRNLIGEGTFLKLENTIKIISNCNISFKQSKSLHQTPLIKNTTALQILTVSEGQMIHNHIDGCLNLHSKKLLFTNFHQFMKKKNEDPFSFIPLTFFIDSMNSQAVDELLLKYDDIANDSSQKNIWIIKPGENSNRGNGIKVVSCKQKIQQELQKRLGSQVNPSKRTVIVQKYLEKCFLINNRKFDIRCYLLVTTVNGILKGYWYKDGYIRTSSEEYSLDDMENEMVHLTNDAVQKKGGSYGKHEDLNKLSYDGFRQYLRKTGTSPYKFDDALEQMKFIAYNLMNSVSQKIRKKQFTFQLFGLDYMFDRDLKPFLIQANSNPCLDNKGKILSKLIHDLVDNVFMTAVDPVFPPPQSAIRRGSQHLNKDYFHANKFQLIFAGKSNTCRELSNEQSELLDKHSQKLLSCIPCDE